MPTAGRINERRKFTRFPFEASVSLLNPRGKWNAKLIDISLNGVLITHPHNWVKHENQEFLVEVNFADSDVHIRMEASIAHSEHGKIGLHCNHIDIDSASHLRRLVELNLGDENIRIQEGIL